MPDLNLYLIYYSVHADNNDWYNAKKHALAKDEDSAKAFLRNSYRQDITIREVFQIECKEGLIF